MARRKSQPSITGIRRSSKMRHWGLGLLLEPINRILAISGPMAEVALVGDQRRDGLPCIDVIVNYENVAHVVRLAS
jgi:hypothetical protein